MDIVVNHIGGIASLITSLTVVGGALMWIYNTFISKPRERRREREQEKRQERMIELITRENKPLENSITQLTDWLNESKKDRENLNRIVNEHNQKISRNSTDIKDHRNRLIVLETKNGIHYKGGD